MIIQKECRWFWSKFSNAIYWENIGYSKGMSSSKHIYMVIRIDKEDVKYYTHGLEYDHNHAPHIP